MLARRSLNLIPQAKSVRQMLSAASSIETERPGAKFDGLLRSRMIMANGSLRDTAVYTIVASEWSMVKANLQWQLDKPKS